MIFGAVNAASGIMSAFGADMSQRAQTDAANQAALRQYEYQNKMIEARNINASNRYNLQIKQYKDQLQLNQTAAQRAYQSEQMRLNEIFKDAAFKSQAREIQRQEALGKVLASGRSGKSASRMAALTNAAAGRNQAIQAESLKSAVNAMNFRNQGTRQKLMAANNRAFGSVAIAPVMEQYAPAPVLRDQPSNLGLIADLASAGASGLTAAYQFDDLIG